MGWEGRGTGAAAVGLHQTDGTGGWLVEAGGGGGQVQGVCKAIAAPLHWVGSGSCWHFAYSGKWALWSIEALGHGDGVLTVESGLKAAVP